MTFDLPAFLRDEQTRPRIKVLLGEFGSGKTELAVTLATYFQQAGARSAVVDMDLVKPYFRTREHRQRLEQMGVTVVAPPERLAHADLPIMPGQLTQVLFDVDCRVVIDVGGSKAAIVLGQIRERIFQNGCEVLMVVNRCRPFSENAAAVLTAIGEVESASGLRVTGLVSNTNLGAETSLQNVLSGVELTRQVAESSGLPLRWIVVPSWLEDLPELTEPVIPLQPMTRYPWDEQE